MKKFNILEWIVMVLVVIGGLNWGLVGAFGLDLVAMLFGSASLVSKVLYDLVGLSALYLLVMLPKMRKK